MLEKYTESAPQKFHPAGGTKRIGFYKGNVAE